MGSGPLPGPGVERLGFPQLRLAHLRDALRGAGHAVRTIALAEGATDALDSGEHDWEGVFSLEEQGPGWVEAAARLASGAERVVSAGPGSPGLLAALVAGSAPLWADIPGDPFAELQAALLVRADGPHAEARVAYARATALATLERADTVSVVSEAQRHAAIGQLGLLGRLDPEDHTERVFVLPVGWSFGLPARAPRPRAAGEPLVVALSGGFNTWFDEETAIQGLERALTRTDTLRVVVTGGGISRHYSRGHERFRRWAGGPGARARVQLTGWVPQQALGAALADAHVGLCLDRAGYEAELGSRTRLLFFAHQGMLGLGTARCALARSLVEEGAMVALPPGDPDALAEALVTLSAKPAPVEALAESQTRLAARFDPVALSAPLLRWVLAPPPRAPIGGLGLALAEENTRLKAELAAVYRSPTWRALSRIHRRVRGR